MSMGKRNISFWASMEIYDYLDDVSSQDDRSISSYVRRLVVIDMKKRKAKEKKDG